MHVLSNMHALSGIKSYWKALTEEEVVTLAINICSITRLLILPGNAFCTKAQ